MIPLSPATRIYLGLGRDGFAQELRGVERLGGASIPGGPFDGHLYVFTNRRKNRIKLLYFDGYGNTEIMGRRFRTKGPFSRENRVSGQGGWSHNYSASRKAKMFDVAFFGARREFGAFR